MKRLLVVCLLVLFSSPAMAYLGPGLGLGVIGMIFGVFAAIVLALFGLFWYPLKRALNRRKAAAAERRIESTVGENPKANQSVTVPTRPESPATTRRENDLANQPGVTDEAARSSTENDSDSQMR